MKFCKIQFIMFLILKVSNPVTAGIKEGQKLDVKFLGKNEKGQMRLSRRQVLMRDAGGGGSGDGAENGQGGVDVKHSMSAGGAEAAYSS